MVTKLIRGQSLYGDKVYTNFFHIEHKLKDLKSVKNVYIIQSNHT
jgi:hypothetical protein